MDAALQNLAAIPPQMRVQNPIAVDRAIATVSFVKQRLADRTGAAVVSDQFLNNLATWLQQIKQESINAAQTGNAQHLVNMQGSVEAIASNLGQVPAIQDSGAVTALLDEATARVGQIQQEQVKASEAARLLFEQQNADLQGAREAAKAHLDAQVAGETRSRHAGLLGRSWHVEWLSRNRHCRED